MSYTSLGNTRTVYVPVALRDGPRHRHVPDNDDGTPGIHIPERTWPDRLEYLLMLERTGAVAA